MKCNIERFKARTFHGLKSLLTKGDVLPPRYLEFAICEAFSLNHVGDGNFYADGVCDDTQVSIKTRMLNPHVLKTKQGRDFQTHPEKFLGPQVNQKHNKWTGGIEIVQRRQALNFNDTTATPEEIGLETLKQFEANIEESFEKYKTSISQEIIGIHGYDHSGKFYIVSLFWQEYKHIDPTKIEWKREGYGVSGYLEVGDQLHKVVERINGNAKREATCFKEYKDLTKYINTVSVRVPIPDPWAFDQQHLLSEIDLKEKLYAVPVLFSE